VDMRRELTSSPAEKSIGSRLGVGSSQRQLEDLAIERSNRLGMGSECWFEVVCGLFAWSMLVEI
jgi:hypothetical protein